MNSVIISLGGSLIVPDTINVDYLKQFRTLVINYLKNKENQLILVCGGGSVCRKYQDAAKQLGVESTEDLDQIGIEATKLNASLVRSLFPRLAYPEIIYNPTKKLKTDKQVVVGCGYKPGYSSDRDAVFLAQNFTSKTILNLTNTSYVYDKDPKLPGARPFTTLSWKQYRTIIAKSWTPGLNVPFDPVASKDAEKLKLRVTVLNGRNLDNVERCLDHKNFIGTTIG